MKFRYIGTPKNITDLRSIASKHKQLERDVYKRQNQYCAHLLFYLTLQPQINHKEIAI